LDVGIMASPPPLDLPRRAAYRKLGRKTEDRRMRLQGKVAIVTGGLSGIGAAIAARFAAEGAVVVAADLAASAGPLDAAAPIAPLHVDVAAEASTTAMAEAVLAAHGRIDILVNSAGFGQDIPFLDTPVAVLDRIMAVNLRGTFLAAQACGRAMREAGSGAIVNIGSVSGLAGSSGRSAYGASKGAIVTLTQVMAMDLAQFGIRVNAIAPGPVDTPLTQRVHTTATRQAWTRATMLRRYGTPAEIAAAALFLASDDASYVTGHILPVDGGFAAAGMDSRP
jgi:NAD(P)-dependent dehydrogenase (short-subunit alcohol dehydrogenase family)